MVDQRKEGAELTDGRIAQAGGHARVGLPILAIGVAAAAVLRVSSKDADFAQRLDQTTLLYLAVAAVLLILPQVKILSLGQFKLEMIERLRAKQDRQDEALSYINIILPLLVAKEEMSHIRNLYEHASTGYVGRGSLRTELRHLCEMRLLERSDGRRVGDIQDGMAINLADYVELTKLGRDWAAKIKEIEAGRAKDGA